jgi:hypothetical protein
MQFQPSLNSLVAQLLCPIQQWLDYIEINSIVVARFLCILIPAQCPFERDIKLCDRLLVHIPPLCKFNPLYDQLTGLRFRALSYLTKCHVDISCYC